jgi:hypothetical protein
VKTTGKGIGYGGMRDFAVRARPDSHQICCMLTEGTIQQQNGCHLFDVLMLISQNCLLKAGTGTWPDSARWFSVSCCSRGRREG